MPESTEIIRPVLPQNVSEKKKKNRVNPPLFSLITHLGCEDPGLNQKLEMHRELIKNPLPQARRNSRGSELESEKKEGEDRVICPGCLLRFG